MPLEKWKEGGAMWGRRKNATVSVTQSGTGATERSRALNSVDDLLRRASWEGLSDGERDALRSAFAPFPASIHAGAELAANADDDRAAQQWVAALVTPGFQSEAAQVIRAWLEDTTPHAHLYIGGAAGQGRTSLVASLARQAMAQRPAPHEYCYVPEPSALDQACLLALPGGTGKDFAGAIDQTLRLLTSAWNGDSDSAPETVAPTRTHLVAQAFAPLEAPAFESARAYVGRLRAAFDALATAQADLPVGYDDLVTWLARPSSGASADGQAGAPVVIGTLIRDKRSEEHTSE